MRHDDPTPPATEPVERLLRWALPVLAVLALVALAAAMVLPSAETAPVERPAASEPAPVYDHAAAEPLELPEESAMAGASIAAYER